MKRIENIIILSMALVGAFGAPADTTTNSLVVSSTEPSSSGKTEGKEGHTLTVPQIYQMHVVANVSNRFAHTTITSKVRNIVDKSQEAVFAVVLPDSAFISGFIMEVDGKNYTAYIQEKEEAKKTYDQAVAQGLGAAHVAVSARDSNRFTVSVNVEPEKKAAFYLTYEELLKRDNGHYEVVVNLHPGQPVEDLSVEVIITESKKITELKAPPLRSGNEIGADKDELDPRADIQVINDTAAVVKFVPNIEKQKHFADLFKTGKDKGLAGQFVVQYDVERDPSGGEILIQDGYFVHFFAPTDLEALPKHVVFVLDTSGSMYGKRIEQLQEAMYKILEQLNDKDLFSLVEFNNNAKIWDLYNSEESVWYPTRGFSWSQSETEELPITNYKFSRAYHANGDNIKKAKETVGTFNADGGTDIHTALKIGLYLVEVEKTQKVDEIDRQSMILFLTDGEPSSRITSTKEIIDKITEYNSDDRKSTIYALSFGDGADRDFLQKLALRNQGFSKYIYESADASLQLQDFYRQISSPLLANITFKYESSAPEKLTKSEYPLYFGGGEIAICGWYPHDVIDPGFAPLPYPIPRTQGWNGFKYLEFKPVVVPAITNIERVWAYMTIKQLLEKKEVDDDRKDTLTKQALDLALKYSFVTPVSSLVVVKPNDTAAVDTEAAGGQGPSYFNQYSTTPHFGQQLFAAPAGFGGGGINYNFAAKPGIPGPPGASYGMSFAQFSTYSPIHLTRHYTTVTPPVLISPKPIDIDAELPWIKENRNEEGLLSLPTGNYNLGSTETTLNIIPCQNSPVGAEGYCTLLHECPQSYSALTNKDNYIKYFCEPKPEFAGVCCPKHP